LHIPDGFLSPIICGATYIVSLCVVGYSIRKVKNGLDERLVPLTALLTALFFAAQMMNYPIIGGTTAHLLGGASLALVLGPYVGCVCMTVILLLQCLLFGDGGITALGANLLTMAVIGTFLPYYVYKLVMIATKNRAISSTVGAFLGDVTAAITAGILLGLSAPIFQYGLEIAVPAMAINHSIIGAGEAIVTAALIAILLKTKPELLRTSPWLGEAEQPEAKRK
jgi:cobalt/nickel transport system permease protein